MKSNGAKVVAPRFRFRLVHQGKDSQRSTAHAVVDITVLLPSINRMSGGPSPAPVCAQTADREFAVVKQWRSTDWTLPLLALLDLVLARWSGADSSVSGVAASIYSSKHRSGGRSPGKLNPMTNRRIRSIVDQYNPHPVDSTAVQQAKSGQSRHSDGASRRWSIQSGTASCGSTSEDPILAQHGDRFVLRTVTPRCCSGSVLS